MNWGPWYIANLKNRQNGQERLVVHTYAREIEIIDKDWQMIEFIGPIDVLKHAESIASLKPLNLKHSAQFFGLPYWGSNQKEVTPKC